MTRTEIVFTLFFGLESQFNTPAAKQVYDFKSLGECTGTAFINNGRMPDLLWYCKKRKIRILIKGIKE